MPLLYEAYQTRFENKEKKKLFHPRIVRLGSVDTDVIAQEIADYSSLTTGDVKNTLDNLVKVMTSHLQQSQIVVLKGLGSFRITMTSRGNGVETAEEVNPSQGTLHVTFKPSYTLNPDRTRATQSLLTGVKFMRNPGTDSTSGRGNVPDAGSGETPGGSTDTGGGSSSGGSGTGDDEVEQL